MIYSFFGLIDRYIIRQFLFGFSFTLILIISIAITIDLGEHIDKFVIHKLSVKYVISEFYINFIPYIIALLGPYFVCITVIFFTSQMASRSEIIAIFNSGVSFKRFLFPYIFSSLLIAIFLWFSNNYIVPETNKKRLQFENKYIAYQPTHSSDHIHRKINDSTFLYFRIYDNVSKSAINVSLEKIIDGKLKHKYLAERALWDTATGTWEFQNYYKREILNDSLDKIEKGEKLKMDFELDPTIFVKRWTYIEELTRPEILDKIADLKSQGVENTAEFECEHHRRSANCFGISILSVLGAIIASKKIRGGMGLHLMAGIALCSIFEVFQKFAISFAIKAHLNPFISVWIPNLIFILIGFLLWKKMQEN